MNRLPEVKRFIYDDIPLFHNVDFVKKPGAPPELCFKNIAGKDVERINLEDYNREECNELLKKWNFYKKSSKDEEVPEEANGPYELKEEL